MYDFISCQVEDREALLREVLSGDDFSVKKYTHPLTGKVSTTYSKLKHNMLLKVMKKTAVIENSIHSYFNSITIGEAYNSNDFSFFNLKHALKSLAADLGIPLVDMKPHSLEFGFNLKLSTDIAHVIRNQILLYKLKSPQYNFDVSGKIGYKNFKLQQYEIKVYNKTLESKEIDTNIIRIEIKYLRRSALNKLGIYSLDDLQSREVLDNVMMDFLRKFDQLTIIDSFDGSTSKSITKSDRVKLIKYTNDSFWNKMRESKQSTYQYHNKEFKKLITLLNLDKVKNHIQRMICEKFETLSINQKFKNNLNYANVVL